MSNELPIKPAPREAQVSESEDVGATLSHRLSYLCDFGWVPRFLWVFACEIVLVFFASLDSWTNIYRESVPNGAVINKSMILFLSEKPGEAEESRKKRIYPWNCILQLREYPFPGFGFQNQGPQPWVWVLTHVLSIPLADLSPICFFQSKGSNNAIMKTCLIKTSLR